MKLFKTHKQMKIKLIIFLIPFALFSCKDAQDKASESVTNTVIEKSLEQAGIATENIERANKNEAQVELSLEGKNLFEKDIFTGIVNVTDRMIVFSLDSENDDAKINITFSGLSNMLESKPIKGICEQGKLDPKDLNGTTTSLIFAKENEFSYNFYNGEITIVKFLEDEIELSISGKVGTFVEANDTSAWKQIEGIIKIQYPIINRIKVSKEQLYYNN